MPPPAEWTEGVAAHLRAHGAQQLIMDGAPQCVDLRPFAPGRFMQRAAGGRGRRRGRLRTVWTETIIPTIERLLNRPRNQIHRLAQNRLNWYEETERLCRLLRTELQTEN